MNAGGGGENQQGGGPGGGYAGGYNMPQGAYPAAAGAPASMMYGNEQQQSINQQQQQHGGDAKMSRAKSDESMTLLDAEQTQAAVAAAAASNTIPPSSDDPHAQAAAAMQTWLDDDTVPTVFRWEHGGRQVYITGTFNGWSRQIPMHRSGNDFTYIHNLKRGKHAFKFIVDDEWRFAPDQPTVADIEGRINNFIDVTDFKAYTGDREFEKEKAAADYGGVVEPTDGADDGDSNDAIDTDASEGSDGMGNRPDKDGEVFSHTMPDLDDYTKEPPPLPPHLRHIILNKPPQLQDTAALPVPQHVALNHLYCTAIKDNMMVLGITQRYKTKFVTTVYYSKAT